jgi:hypothetical protein
MTLARGLDFIVIGAQKSGTTALHEYLRTHPQLCLPPAKEMPFFSHDPVYQRGWEHWFVRAFPADQAGSVYGKVTPHYMAGAPYGERVTGAKYGDAPPETVTPQRIHDLFPDIRLIALLRDPVARCISHHKMTSLLGWESRTLGQAVEELLVPAELEQARRAPTQLNGYLVWGEYARILAPYYDLFGSSSIRVFFTSDLDNQPQDVVCEIFDFVGVDATYLPPNLGRRYYEGANRLRIDWLDFYRLQEAAARSSATRRAWHMVPRRVRRRIAIAYEMAHYRTRMWNRVKETEAPSSEPIAEELIQRLREHFRTDTEALEQFVGQRAPWSLPDPTLSSASR